MSSPAGQLFLCTHSPLFPWQPPPSLAKTFSDELVLTLQEVGRPAADGRRDQQSERQPGENAEAEGVGGSEGLSRSPSAGARAPV